MSPPSGWQALRHREFRLACGLRLCAGLANQMQTVTVGWLMWRLTRDPLMLGLAGLVAFLPALLLALPAGQVADRNDRRAVVLAGALPAVLGGVLMFAWSLHGISGVIPLLLAVAAFACLNAFVEPAFSAMKPNLVPREELAGAIALATAIGQTTVIAGPALGGVLSAVGAEVAFGAILLLHLCAAVFAWRLKPQRPAVTAPSAGLSDVLAGLRFIRARPVVLGAITLDLFAVLLGGATALLPIFADDILQVGPLGLGVLRAAPAVGAACIGAWLAHRPIRRRAGRTLLVTVAVFGLFTVGFGLSEVFWLSLVCLAGLGAADMVSMAIRGVLVAADTPDAMRGRVLAVESVFIGASNELGEFESGVLAALVGAAPAVVIGGVGTLLVVAGCWHWLPALRDRDRLVEAPSDPAVGSR